MAEPARNFSPAATLALNPHFAPSNSGRVHLRAVPQAEYHNDLADLRDRQAVRARFWQVLLPGLALFWGGVVWLVVT